MTKSYLLNYNISTMDDEVIPISAKLTEADCQKAAEFLKRMRPLLITGEYTIRPSWKNTEFDDEYPLREDQKRSILKSLTVDDCIKVEANSNSRYEESELFFFLKDATFNVYGEETTVKLYLKMYIRETKTHNMVIVISFHKNGLFD